MKLQQKCQELLESYNELQLAAKEDLNLPHQKNSLPVIKVNFTSAQGSKDKRYSE